MTKVVAQVVDVNGVVEVVLNRILRVLEQVMIPNETLIKRYRVLTYRNLLAL